VIKSLTVLDRATGRPAWQRPPLVQLKPEVEAAIVQYHHGRALDEGLTAKLQQRARSSDLQRIEGDQRLRIATRGGRKSLAVQLSKELRTLLNDHRGASGRLLRRCRLNEAIPGTHDLMLELTLFGHVSIPVADGMSHNVRHDIYGSLKDRIRAGWTRTLAKSISEQAHRDRPAVHQDAQAELQGLLIVTPDVAKSTWHLEKLPVADALAALLVGEVYLTLDAEPRLDAYESEARWNVDASVGVRVHLEPVSLMPLVFTDVQEAAASGEVVR